MNSGGRNDRGSAIVDFVLVTPILLALALAVLQLILVMHVRTVLISAAAEGARAAALADSNVIAGERRARAIIKESVAASVVERMKVQPVVSGGNVLMAIDIDARLPLIGMLGPTLLHVQGHALQEHA